jgi:hypothetical protein
MTTLLWLTGFRSRQGPVASALFACALLLEGDSCRCDDPGFKGFFIGAPIGAGIGAVLGSLVGSS